MADRVFLQHEVTGGTTEVINDPDVLAEFADRGWHPASRPATSHIFIPDPSGHGGKALDDSFFGTAPKDTKDDTKSNTKDTKKAAPSATTTKGE